jgi:hypothetical protein
MRKVIPFLALLTLLVFIACGDDSGSPVASPESTSANVDNEVIKDGRGNQDTPVQDEPAVDSGVVDSVTPPADVPIVEEPEEVVDPVDVEEPSEGLDPVDVDVSGAEETANGELESPVEAETPGSIEDDGRGESSADLDEVDLRPANLPSPTGVNPPLQGTFLDIASFPRQYLFSGAAKDAIPALTNPIFVRPSEVSYLLEDDLVLGVVVDGVARAYPENIGWWHEIVNDRIGSRSIAVTFCPLTGTGLVFKAEDESGQQFELGVSGLLFNSNLVMYDRRNDSLYPQLLFTSIFGSTLGDALELLPVVETTWRTWKRLYPTTEVIAATTGWNRSYTSYPYADYRTDDGDTFAELNPSLGFNDNPHALRYGAKDKILGVRLNGDVRAYLFETLGDRLVLNDVVGEVDIVVVFDYESHLAIPYARQIGDLFLNFDIVEDQGFPFNMMDEQTGSIWNIKGQAIEGPLKGAQLTQVPAHTGFWFAWVTFWQNTRVWSL